MSVREASKRISAQCTAEEELTDSLAADVIEIVSTDKLRSEVAQRGMAMSIAMRSSIDNAVEQIKDQFRAQEREVETEKQWEQNREKEREKKRAGASREREVAPEEEQKGSHPGRDNDGKRNGVITVKAYAAAAAGQRPSGKAGKALQIQVDAMHLQEKLEDAEAILTKVATEHATLAENVARMKNKMDLGKKEHLKKHRELEMQAMSKALDAQKGLNETSQLRLGILNDREEQIEALTSETEIQHGKVHPTLWHCGSHGPHSLTPQTACGPSSRTVSSMLPCIHRKPYAPVSLDLAIAAERRGSLEDS